MALKCLEQREQREQFAERLPRTRSITNFYLLNLAVADLLRSVVCMPLTLLSELTKCWLLGPMMCKAVAYLQPVGVCASAYTLAVIAVERYYAICRPLQSRKWRTKKRALFTISLVWVFSFVCNTGSLFIFDSVPYRTQWTCDTTKGPLIDFLYQLYITLVLLFIPLCAMVSLYGHVIYALSTAIVSDHPTMQQSLIQAELPMTTFSDWLFASVTRVPSINGLNAKEKQQKEQSLSIPGSKKCSLSRPSSRLTSINTLFGTPRSSFDTSMLLRSTNQDKILTAKKKVTRMLMTIVVAFAVCWLPSHIWWLLVRASDLAGFDVMRGKNKLNSPVTISWRSLLSQLLRKPLLAEVKLVNNSNAQVQRQANMKTISEPSKAVKQKKKNADAAPSNKTQTGVPIWHSGLNMVLTILTYISSTTNPVTYCFMNKGFRASVLSYCTRKKRPTSCSAPNSRKSPTKDGAKDTANTIPMIKGKAEHFGLVRGLLGPKNAIYKEVKR
ncbi:7 transmembrane receptor [Ancylostoma ceylanicum]|uniref:7 transmembrane receptor n=1 Tax=Ancylostoma ceylanicum TaxID=53326 RepID=A0A0D6LII8_9BILA|nr:7 transmembrane receptor [Ancylostoma ceylanicum]